MHGPYWTLRWREGRRQRKAYVPAAEVDAVFVALAGRRLVAPPAWSIRQALAQIRRLAENLEEERL